MMFPKQFTSAGMKGMEPSLDQPRNSSVNLLGLPHNGTSTAQGFSVPLIHFLEASSNHVDMLSSNLLSPNPRPLCVIPPGHAQEGLDLPIASFKAEAVTFHSQTDIPYQTTEVLINPLVKRLDNSPTFDIDTSGVNMCSFVLSTTDTEAAPDFSKALCPVDNKMLMENAVVPQRYSLIKWEPDEYINDVPEIHSEVIIPSREARCQNARERVRRDKIAEGIKALKSSVPCSDKGNKESVLDDTIDYIKFLKLQLKALSQSRLRGEATPYPFVHLEGYGHYLLQQQQACSEPLEEIMGQLLEVNPQSANALLERKGLALLPMDLAYTLLQPSSF